MILTLYTSRIVLDVLGVDDYAIYGVIGGVVIVVSSIGNTMSTALQRFLNFESGKGNVGELSKIFNIGLVVMIVFSIIIVIVCETFGIWLVNNVLNIPTDRLFAAKWVFQFAILSVVSVFIRIPFMASVISEEKMSCYAILSIVESILKLVIALILARTSSLDKLILYSFLMMCVSLIILIFYFLYCHYKILFCKIKLLWDKVLFKQIFSFAGWNFLGIFSEFAVPQIVSMVINIFVTLVVNTAFLIANQVNQAIYNFVISFQMAFRPQITKLYAAQDITALKILLERSSKFSFFLLLYIAIPFIICADFVIDVWLVDVPAYTVSFCRLMVIASLFDAVSAPIWMLVHATGAIKNYQIGTFILSFMMIPLSVVFLYFHLSPLYILLSKVFISFLVMIYRLYYIKIVLNFDVKNYCNNVLLKAIVVLLLSSLLPVLLNGLTDGWANVLIVSITSIITISIFVLLLGLTSNERISLQQMALSFIRK